MLSIERPRPTQKEEAYPYPIKCDLLPKRPKTQFEYCIAYWNIMNDDLLDTVIIQPQI